MTTPRWYMVNKDGMATLCTSKKDAEKEARAMDMAWPHMGPHRAVQLVEAADAQKESFDHGPQATSIEEAARDVGKWLNERPNRPLDLRHVAMLCAHAAPAAVAGPHVTDAMALAFHRALSDGAIGSDEVEEIKAGLRAALDAAPTTQQAPQQEAQEPVGWNSLTDEDRERAMNSMPGMLEGFMKTWGWLHFAKAIEAICREKNAQPSPAAQGDALKSVLDAFERKERNILQAHVAAALVAELRAAIDDARTAQEGN